MVAKLSKLYSEYLLGVGVIEVGIKSSPIAESSIKDHPSYI